MAEDPKQVAAEQADDVALWGRAEHAETAYVQQALRRLTKAVEGDEDGVRG